MCDNLVSLELVDHVDCIHARLREVGEVMSSLASLDLVSSCLDSVFPITFQWDARRFTIVEIIFIVINEDCLVAFNIELVFLSALESVKGILFEAVCVVVSQVLLSVNVAHSEQIASSCLRLEIERILVVHLFFSLLLFKLLAHFVLLTCG